MIQVHSIEKGLYGLTLLNLTCLLTTWLEECCWLTEIPSRLISMVLLWSFFIKNKHTLKEISVAETCIRIWSEAYQFEKPIQPIREWDVKCLTACFQNEHLVNLKERSENV
jgi:hypothetical protein